VHPPAATPSQPRVVLRLRRRPYPRREKYRTLNVLDEFTHESLANRVGRKLNAIEVIDVLSDPFIARGVPADIRSDYGPEFVAKTPLTNALKLRAVQTHYFFGVTRPFLQASVNSSLESLPSLLVSAELKFLTAD
jgi:hypothetical protein